MALKAVVLYFLKCFNCHQTIIQSVSRMHSERLLSFLWLSGIFAHTSLVITGVSCSFGMKIVQSNSCTPPGCLTGASTDILPLWKAYGNLLYATFINRYQGTAGGGTVCGACSKSWGAPPCFSVTLQGRWSGGGKNLDYMMLSICTRHSFWLSSCWLSVISLIPHCSPESLLLLSWMPRIRHRCINRCMTLRSGEWRLVMFYA